MGKQWSSVEQRREVEAWRRSGLSAERFAKGRGYCDSSLLRWSRVHREVEFAKLVITAPVAARSEVVIAIGAAQISVRPGFDKALLREVVEVLSEGAPR